MPARQLLALAQQGRLTRYDPVCFGPDGAWLPAETIDGLFSFPLVPQLSPKRTDVTPFRPVPAKRSVHKSHLIQYWVKNQGVVVGPISSEKLRALASEGKLRPDCLISVDQKCWIAAAHFGGLAFGGASSHDATTTIRTLVLLDEPLRTCPEPVGASN